MTPQGGSIDWAKGQANQQRILASFLLWMNEVCADESEQWGLTWEAVPEAELCTEKFFGIFAQYLLETYLIPNGCKNAGKLLDSASAIAVWSGAINQTRLRFSKSTRQQTQARHTALPAPCACVCPIAHPCKGAAQAQSRRPTPPRAG